MDFIDEKGTPVRYDRYEVCERNQAKSMDGIRKK